MKDTLYLESSVNLFSSKLTSSSKKIHFFPEKNNFKVKMEESGMNTLFDLMCLHNRYYLSAYCVSSTIIVGI